MRVWPSVHRNKKQAIEDARAVFLKNGEIQLYPCGATGCPFPRVFSCTVSLLFKNTFFDEKEGCDNIQNRDFFPGDKVF